MSLCVEDPTVKRKKAVVREDEVEVFECFGEEEAFLDATTLWLGVVNVCKTRVASFRTAILLECLQPSEKNQNEHLRGHHVRINAPSPSPACNSNLKNNNNTLIIPQGAILMWSWRARKIMNT